MAALDVIEKEIEKVGRMGDSRKLAFDENMPIQHAKTEWVGEHPEGESVVVVNPGNFEEICRFIHDAFTKEDFERAVNVHIGAVMTEVTKWKRNAESVVAVMKTWGTDARGPKRLKITVLLLCLTMAKKERTTGS